MGELLPSVVVVEIFSDLWAAGAVSVFHSHPLPHSGSGIRNLLQ